MIIVFLEVLKMAQLSGLIENTDEGLELPLVREVFDSVVGNGKE